ncbi:MAG: tetratricopeptide repeat protein [Gammaproteobacteria bacterium]|jgi:tetratricopeptide (TPR) repeat protein|nr:tetratricopeptide repeat protein [Gammaproteobacteria bacterium]
MTRDTRFWTFLVIFQVFFGLTVFAFTREYYLQDAEVVSGHPPTGAAAATSWSRGITPTDISRLSSPGIVEPTPSDPAEIYRRAEEFFSNRQYAQAAQLYEQLLAYSPNDAEIYNNLGLTLFYIGRTDEALRKLNDGVAVDAEHQRIWLTLGFVNSQLGNTEQARLALTKATQVGGSASIRESAEKMLAELP